MKKNLLFLFSLLFIIFTSIQTVFAQGIIHNAANSNETKWIWVYSDSRYGKLYAPSRITVTQRKNGIPICIEAWIKTTYSAAGAAETVSAMNMSKEIHKASDLRYSLALVEIDPQNRTIKYTREIFYDARGNILTSHVYDKPRLKEINSQSFDENFYDAIVDHVFNEGETQRAKASDRWITLWRNVNAYTAVSATADTTTIRKHGNDIIIWIWQETRNNTGGQIKEIRFYKKVFNLSTYSYRIAAYSLWTPKNKWQNKTNTLKNDFISIVPDSRNDWEFRSLKKYIGNHPKWVSRYQTEFVATPNEK
ncbi:hypothetical protein [Pectinatus sottacetonis]|uniref:hypothetical protein n=1 Tax=Pectinatus sottacetonis TaxID=1002795 RepID=UPI0018C79687|nr:hypothetical protein [Pectinatus sottacetonis]